MGSHSGAIAMIATRDGMGKGRPEQRRPVNAPKSQHLDVLENGRCGDRATYRMLRAQTPASLATTARSRLVKARRAVGR
jgi:hypothetical protein